MSKVTRSSFRWLAVLQLIWTGITLLTGGSISVVLVLLGSVLLFFLVITWDRKEIYQYRIEWWHVAGIACIYWPIAVWSVILDGRSANSSTLFGVVTTFLVFTIVGVDLLIGGRYVFPDFDPEET